MGEIETAVKMPQITTTIPSMIDVTSIKSFENIETRSCPLCRSEVRLFFINFNDKMLMCENTKCEFPFGYEELVFVKADEETQSHVELDSLTSKITPETATPCVSTVCSAWSEIEKLNRVYDSEDSQAFEAKALEPKEYMNLKNLMRRKEPIQESSITTSLKEIKELTIKMEENHPNIVIKNETFLKNLMELQRKPRSDRMVIKPEEMSLVKSEPVTSTTGLRFDIKSEGSMPSININIVESPQPNNSGDEIVVSVGDPV